MKKTIVTLAFLGACLSFQSVHAQLAKKKGITLEEISKEISVLAQKEDDASKKQLLIEAKALADSKNEKFVSFAARIYDYLDHTEEAEKINNSLLKRFPKGVKARSEAYKDVFADENISATDAEKKYNQFLSKFPAKNFDEKDQALYTTAESELAALYFKETNNTKANEYLDKIKKSGTYIQNGYSLTNKLIKNKDYAIALPILDDLIQKAKEDKVVGQNYMTALSSLYGTALYETGNYEKAAITVQEQISNNRNATNSATMNLLLANAFTKVGNDLDAFLTLEKFTVKNGKNPEVETLLKSLYEKLNNNKGDYNKYSASLESQIKEATLAKYKAEMIKKEAPNFSLVNMEGKTVSLADLKGKVLVLDFWATWCGPCKISFPGMQAAVNKYKDDKDVEFLFINTWQNEKNYEELVRNFIAENKYSFHVLFDEMKDRSKSTVTAYGVKGIPHKVVIDKEGFIRFESAGGSADVEKIVNEMETKIELARKG